MAESTIEIMMFAPVLFMMFLGLILGLVLYGKREWAECLWV